MRSEHQHEGYMEHYGEPFWKIGMRCSCGEGFWGFYFHSRWLGHVYLNLLRENRGIDRANV